MRGNRGIQYSALLHGIILFLMIVGLPDFMRRPPDPEPEAISVDILPLAPMSNVKPQERPEKEEKKPVKETRTEKKAAPETKKEEPKPEEQAVPLPVKKVVTKKEEKKPDKKKAEKQKKDDLDSILKSVKDEAKAEENKKPSETKPQPDTHPAKSQVYDASLPLSISEKDFIRSQIEKCWSVPAGAKDAYNLLVTLHLEYAQDGSLMKVELAQDQSRYGSDPFFRAAADAAIRAVERCSPLKGLPADKYGGGNGWGEMEMTFNPKDMLY